MSETSGYATFEALSCCESTGIYTLLRVFVQPVMWETKFQTHTKRTGKITTHGNQI